MDVASLLLELEALNVKLTLEDGRLRYSAPKGILSPALLARLSSEKERLISFLQQRVLDSAWEETPIPRQPRTRGLPLSTAQQRFWFLDQLDRDSRATFVMPPIVLRLRGDLNVGALREALNEVVQRHEVLRSAFRIEGDAPVQIPLAQVDFDLALHDLSAQDDAAREIEAARIVREQASMPFDLQCGEILMRALLLRCASREHVFVLTMHHIICDGWSMGILVDEISQLYRHYSADPSRNGASPLPALPVQYADYAHWEKARMSGERLAGQLTYWRTQLEGAPGFLALPTDHQRPAIRRNFGRAEHFSLDADLSRRLCKLCAQASVTPFMALLAALGVLLCRHTDVEDMVVGSPISVRPHSQTESLIGLFLNTLALRLDLSANPSFIQLLERVKKTALEAYEHCEMPFDQILGALGVERNLDHTPLFQVLFALQNAPMGEVTLEALSITAQPTESLHAPFDLVLSMEESPQGFKGFFRYNTDLFDPSSVVRLISHFLRLLGGLIDTPNASVRTLPMLDTEEALLLADWRGGKEQFKADISLHRVFELWAQTRPEAIAVCFEDTSLSYRALDQRANQVAHRLLRQGVSRGDRVGLCVERSVELVVGILGILKVGAAYVPLDTSYPEERLQYMAQDSKLGVVVAYRTKPRLDASIVDLGDSGLADEAATLPDVTGSFADVAYVIYTSGSTGRPKGVEVTHANVARLFACSETLFGFGADDVWCLFHSYAFDFSVWELWGALLYGARVVVVPFAITRSPDQFHDLIKRTGVTVLNQTPSAFRQLIDADRRSLDRHSVDLRPTAKSDFELALKWVIFGGEALDPRSLSAWVDRHGLEAPQLINMYGITETTVHVTFHRLSAQDIAAGGSVIGRPLPDLSIDLLDRYGQQVAIGVAGEIIVGGDGVAKGYLNLPAQTAERFIDPSMQSSGTALASGVQAGRAYRSGDLARWRPDGNLEYLGRIDQQVKIRGFRIEMGEIETCLAQHPLISEAAVDVQNDALGARLIAYVVAKDWQDAALPSTLRAFLSSRLPDYMVPAMVLVLERMPLTTNGKLDRKALAMLLAHHATEGIKGGAGFVPAQTPMERLLAELWCQVLGIPEVGVDQNFFELGGDSIRGAILANKLQERLHSVVYVVALFEAPTIRRLVEYLCMHYPEAMARLGALREATIAVVESKRITESDVESFRRLIPPTATMFPGAPPAVRLDAREINLSSEERQASRRGQEKRNPRAIFVLSPPRSGSTLLRVLLGGHRRLFSPPELELLGFDTLLQRKQICSGRDAFWLEGTLRAVMEALHVDADEAKRIMAAREGGETSVKSFYGELQSWLDGRILVDKSPSYALDVGVMQRAEEYFDEPLYLHLHRHPYGMISSFEEAKLDQIFFRYPHKLQLRRLAELIWLHSHRNIIEFLAEIPRQRQLAIGFEEISQKPEHAVRRLCEFMAIDYEPEMLSIYDGENPKTRMTDGIHQESKMLGDIKFHTHSRIDPTVADRWRDIYKEDFLGEPSWDMAQTLGYARRVQTGTDAIETVARDAQLPLSFAQQRLWFLDRLDGAGTAYNMPVALRLKGPLQRDALAAAFRAIVDRHEVLRSRIEIVDGVPAVCIAQSIPVMEEFDLSGYSPEQKSAEVIRRTTAHAEAVFDLEHGPLFRSALLILAPLEYVVLVNVHHIVSDGWSMGVMVGELSSLYNALATGRNSPLPLLHIQYADYASWQRRHLAGDVLKRQMGYWRAHLAGAPALLELPTDRPRPAIQRFFGDTMQKSLGPALSVRLKRLADQSGVSQYMLLMAAFAVLLMRYSGQRDVVMGSPSANRSRIEVEPLIGFFVNTLVMRLALAPDQAFAEFLAHTRNIALEAYAHHEVSFEQLVEELRPQRNLSYSPLFQVMFSMQNTPSVTPALDLLEVTEIASRQVVSKYDLTLAITDRNGVLEASFEYNTDLFDRETVTQLGAHYSNLLEGIAADPNQSVDRLPLLAAKEVERMSVEWNRTAATYSGSMSLHGLFEAQARRTPEAIAVQFQDEKLSYQVLDERADQLAAHLRDAGLRPGTLAAMCVERSPDMLIALLAILKTGSAYVPLDRNYPQERIRFVLDDACVCLLVTQARCLSGLPAVGCNVFVLDRDNVVARPIAAPVSANGPITGDDALAYVIYTSGSTGKPKGVMVGHRAAVNFLYAMREAPGIRAEDILLAVTTISFDIAVLELFLPLSVGARIVIADEATTRDASELIKTIAAQQVTLMQATPATWRMLLAIGWEGASGMKILCGGEALNSALAGQLLACCGELWNMYGPTETTVWSAIQRVTEADLLHSTIPIGRPIANTRMLILDGQMNLQPVGVTGELFIGGDGLASGYLDRTELTLERFLADPFMPGQRLYRTGDLARYLRDGRIEFLGRSDQQVKVRGFRVELGELEHVLARQSGVQACAAVLDRDSSGDARMVAYYSGEKLGANELRCAMLEVLPDYMVPSLFVHIQAMPLTPNGKVDRLALRLPDDARAQGQEEHIGFRDNIEMSLVHIWEEVLEMRPIGIRDNFFDLGGHSIIAVRLMAKIAHRFGRHLPLASLFQGATVESMAMVLRGEINQSDWTSLVPIQTQGNKAPFFCAAGAGGNVVYFHDLARAMGADRPFFGLQPPGLDGVTHAHRSVEDLARHYIGAIEHERHEFPSIVAGHSFGGLVAFEMARQLQDAGHPPQVLVLIDTPAPQFLRPTGENWSQAQWLAQVSEIVAHMYTVDARIGAGQFEALEIDAQLGLLHRRLIAVGVLPVGSDIRYFRGFVDVYKANLRLSYAPKELHGNTRVLLLRSREQQPEALVSEQFAVMRDTDDLGWKTYFDQPITVSEVPGDHLTMMRSPNVTVLAATLAGFCANDC